jgi:hypothetical protein
MAKLLIDRKHTEMLLRGDPVTIKTPGPTTTIVLSRGGNFGPSKIEKIIDIFFNGRKAD